MAKKTVIAPPPQLNGIPRVDFLNPDFDTLIWNKGYNILLEKAMACPCSRKTQPVQSACLNCFGTGFFYFNSIQTKAVIQSINNATKYKDWSAELIGTVNITIEERFRFSYRDRITVLDSTSIGSEVQLVRHSNNTFFIYTVYPIKKIIKLFKYVDNTSPLIEIKDGFEVKDNIITFDTGIVVEGDSISIRYEHNLQYAIIDINHDVRNSYRLDNNSREKQNLLPTSAIARKLQYIHDAQNINGMTVIDNGTD